MQGSNELVARFSGVNVSRVRLFVYTLIGGFCALAGVMNAGLLPRPPPTWARQRFGRSLRLRRRASLSGGGRSWGTIEKRLWP
jgi:ABC-type xylose transport system permease subunit